MGDVFLIFGINWVMLGTAATLLFCWRNWFGKHGSVIWNMVLGCLMWIVWKEWNGHLFEDNVTSLDQSKSVFNTLFGHGVGIFLIVHLFLSSLLHLDLPYNIFVFSFVPL